MEYLTLTDINYSRNDILISIQECEERLKKAKPHEKIPICNNILYYKSLIKNIDEGVKKQERRIGNETELNEYKRMLESATTEFQKVLLLKIINQYESSIKKFKEDSKKEEEL